jgi:tetraacyldisaccharide 4'-kinase
MGYLTRSAAGFQENGPRRVNGIDADAFLRLIRGQSRGLAASLARLGLGFGSGVYRVAVSARNGAYDRGWKTVHRASVPVISVGNITLGGTGKTPMVEWLARWYRRRGVRVALVSRGYGHAGGINDEGLVLEENLPDVPHLQDPDRVRLAAIAVEELETELIILDDGFQHRRLGRDVDLVMLDALDPFGLGRLFPRGLLREPLGSLRRASAIVLSRADLIEKSDRTAIRQTIQALRSSVPLIDARHAPLDLIDGDGQSESLKALSGRSIAAFCGIGNPEGFRRTLEPLCGRIAEFRIFPDHHRYTAEDVASLASWARASGANLALTTQKDLVKLRTASLGPVKLWALRIGLEITDGLEALEELLRPLVRTTRSGPFAEDDSARAVPPSRE